MQFDIINTQQQLIDFVASIDNTPLSLDTEFVRTRTYYANLGLLQVCQNNKITLIDPIAIENLTPFWQAIDGKQCILHASSEDLEIIKQLKGDLNIQLFDTQIACAFLNYGSSLGYAKMVEQLQSQVLDKGESRTDWCARPLTDKQLNYAAADVLHLQPCLEQLLAELKEKGKLQLFEQECAMILEQKMRTLDPDKAYKSLDNLFRLDRYELAILRALAKWRLQTAQSRNLAVNFVMKSEHLWLLAHYQPKSINDLKRLKLLPNEIRIHGQQVLNIIASVADEDPEQYPQLVTRLVDFPDYKNTMKSMRDKIKACAEKYELPAELIASKRVINEYLSWSWKLTEQQRQQTTKPKLLTGWRYEIVGHEFQS